jgi:hypothetical protein
MHQVFHRWDSQWYLAIASEGYKYEALEVGESVAFFPLYPLLMNSLTRATGLPLELTGLLIPHIAFLTALAVFFHYVRDRFPHDREVSRYALLALVVFPAGFFFRFIYSESLFMLLAILSMYLMHRGHSLLLISFVVGLATASRPVGIALLLPLLVQVWRKEQSVTCAIRSSFMVLPIGCWGLIAYIVFQHMQFAEPFAFAKTQHHWRLRPAAELGEMMLSFAAWEPIWSVYVSASPTHWQRFEPHAIPCLSLAFWNPIVLITSATLIAIGYRRSWLTLDEVLLAAGLLLIPYVTRGYHFCMLSQARFSSVVFPVYIVAAHVLRRSPPIVAWTLICVAAFLLLYFSARFSAGFGLT